jgi:hypothetical protein
MRTADPPTNMYREITAGGVCDVCQPGRREQPSRGNLRERIPQGYPEKDLMMTRIDYIAPVLAAVAIALLSAPTASATVDDQACSDVGGSTQCQRAADVQIYAKPHALPSASNSTYGPFVGYHNGRN